MPLPDHSIIVSGEILKERDDQLARQQKIIVALFLCLGKAYEMLNAAQRDKLVVSETEIAEAWTKQESPVRLLSERPNFDWAEERIFRVVPGKLDLKKTGMKMSGQMPKEPKELPMVGPHSKKRVFDLE